jgi:octaheme c-type cytochrome (tetrathionate reductase family)
MRRISLVTSLLGVLAAAGCAGGGADPSSSGTGRGVPGSTFTVQVRGEKAYLDPATSTTVFLPDGGLVTASGGIACGFQDGVASTACSADYPWGDADAPTTVTVTATPVAAGGFYAFAGSCTGVGSPTAPSVCAVTGNADRMVLVRFAPSAAGLGGHPNWSPSLATSSLHVDAFRSWAADPRGYEWKCKECHGMGLQGQGIAPSCTSCHTGGRSMKLHDGSYFAFKLSAVANGPAVTTVCLECHAQQAADFMGTQHWTWRGPTPQLFDVDGTFQPSTSPQNPGTIGKANLVNNFCVSVASNEKRCDQCHAGYGNGATNLSARSPTYVNDPTRVDCLICHASSVTGNMASGGYNKIAGAFGAAGYAVGPGAPTASTAQLQAWATSLRLPTRDNCGWCHFNGGGADSVKVMSTALRTPSASVDVHMSPAAGDLSCADCHADPGHGIRGAGVHTPTSYARTSCEDCHGAAPHQDPEIANGALLNQHADTVACQTCHIPAYSRGMPGKMDWDWSTAGWKTAAFPHPATLYACVDGTTETPYAGQCSGTAKVKKYDYMKGTFAWAQNVPPAYRWYNGTMTHVETGDRGAFTIETGLTTATSDRITLSAPLGDRTDLTAKIYPFKLMTGRQAVYVDDAGGNSFVITPKLFQATGGDGAFWGVLAAQPPGTTHTYAYDPTGMTTTEFGAPADSLSGTFTVSAYAGYPSNTPIPIETLLSNVFTKGAAAAGQYDPVVLGTMARYDGVTVTTGWDWRYTKMYMDLEHEVAPAAQALGCGACHGATPVMDFTQLGYGCANPADCPRTP